MIGIEQKGSKVHQNSFCAQALIAAKHVNEQKEISSIRNKQRDNQSID